MYVCHLLVSNNEENISLHTICILHWQGLWLINFLGADNIALFSLYMISDFLYSNFIEYIKWQSYELTIIV